MVQTGILTGIVKKLTPPDVSNTVILTAQHDPVGTTISHNLKTLTKKHNDQKLAITLLIVGTSLIAYHFWEKINSIIIIHSRWCRGKCTGF